MFAILLLFLLAIFFFHYLLIKHILKPVNWLDAGVNEVGQGNLSYQIPVKSNDELGKLSSSFNSMITQINQMIKSKDQLLLDVSHELRSPITRMKIALEFLKKEKVRKSIEDDLKEMEYMIEEILETERLKGVYGKLTLKKSNLIEIIKTISFEYKGKKPYIDISALPDSVILDLDEERIKTVLKNILENAFKYSLPDSRAIKIKVDEKEQSADLFITDDGIGVPEEHIPYLFEPFYRTDKSRSKDTGGYGLGLSLCKKIIEAHNGEIKISNNRNSRGVTIAIKFYKAFLT
jgi:signal transduction histidine kinase